MTKPSNALMKTSGGEKSLSRPAGAVQEVRFPRALLRANAGDIATVGVLNRQILIRVVSSHFKCILNTTERLIVLLQYQKSVRLIDSQKFSSSIMLGPGSLYKTNRYDHTCKILEAAKSSRATIRLCFQHESLF